MFNLKKTTIYDYNVTFEGSLVGIHPENPTAIQFLDENVEADSWRYLGNTLYIELNHAAPILKLLKDNGLVVHIEV